MKNLKTLLIIAAITFGFTTVNAQKMAHVNMQELMQAMPQTVAMNTKLEKLGKTYGDDLKAAEEAFKAKYLKFQQEAASQTPEVNEKRQLELKQDERKIVASQQAANKDMQEQMNALSTPIIEAAKKAVNMVAKTQGFGYVIDSSIPAFVVTDGTDLLPLVKTHLGIK